MNLSVCHLLRRNLFSGFSYKSLVHYSRNRNATGSYGPYKIVKTENSCDDSGNLNQIGNNNWELFETNGYPFYLPGNVGPAWQNTETSESFVQVPLIPGSLNNKALQDLNTNNLKEKRLEKKFTCFVQECPIVLRKDVSELFSNRDIKNSVLTVVTLVQKFNSKQLRSNREIEIERLTKSFVLTAQDICMTLTVMGYWADFINPFSGKPYLSPTQNTPLYSTDERFRCLGFQIFQKHNCKIISSEVEFQMSQSFIGSLFTNAPHNIGYLQDIKSHLA